MADLLEHYDAQLNALCKKHQVRTLEVFGSAASGTWDATTSDLDFLVDFLPLSPGQGADAYFGLLFDLEDLFHRKIDLVEARAVKNAYFLASINQNRKVLYAA